MPPTHSTSLTTSQEWPNATSWPFASLSEPAMTTEASGPHSVTDGSGAAGDGGETIAPNELSVVLDCDWLARLVDGHIGENSPRHKRLLGPHVTLHPNFDRDFHRGSAD